LILTRKFKSWSKIQIMSEKVGKTFVVNIKTVQNERNRYLRLFPQIHELNITKKSIKSFFSNFYRNFQIKTNVRTIFLAIFFSEQGNKTAKSLSSKLGFFFQYFFSPFSEHGELQFLKLKNFYKFCNSDEIYWKRWCKKLTKKDVGIFWDCSIRSLWENSWCWIFSVTTEPTFRASILSIIFYRRFDQNKKVCRKIICFILVYKFWARV